MNKWIVATLYTHSHTLTHHCDNFVQLSATRLDKNTTSRLNKNTWQTQTYFRLYPYIFIWTQTKWTWNAKTSPSIGNKCSKELCEQVMNSDRHTERWTDRQMTENWSLSISLLMTGTQNLQLLALSKTETGMLPHKTNSVRLYQHIQKKVTDYNLWHFMHLNAVVNHVQYWN